MWVLEGMKGFYDGYYSAFYRSSKLASLRTCLDEQTIDDIVALQDVIENPLSLFMSFDLTKDLHIFGSVSEIASDIFKCNL